MGAQKMLCEGPRGMRELYTLSPLGLKISWPFIRASMINVYSTSYTDTLISLNVLSGMNKLLPCFEI